MATSSCVSGLRLLPDAELVRAEEHVGQRVGRALMLEHRVPRHVPAVAEHARGVVERQPAEVARLLTWNAVGLILVIAAGPVADEVDLREGWRRPQQHQQPARQRFLSGSLFKFISTCVLDEVLCRCSFKSGRHDTS